MLFGISIIQYLHTRTDHYDELAGCGMVFTKMCLEKKLFEADVSINRCERIR